MKNKNEALKMEANRCADYWANHYDRKSKGDMELLRKHVFEQFQKIAKEALAEAESESSSQPVAWTDLEGNFTVSPNEKFWYPFPLYTHPNQPLDDEAISEILNLHGFDNVEQAGCHIDVVKLIRDVEQAHGI